MNSYVTENLRNVCLLGHGDTGKTSLAEAMLFNAGASDRMGKVAEGNTTTDFDPEEVRRRISINVAMAPFEWKDAKVNLIDTPGYFDFVGEVMQGVRVADSAVIVVPAKGGGTVGTEKSWSYAVKMGIPRMFYVSKMDEENADFGAVLDGLRQRFGVSVTPMQIPIVEGERYVGFADVLTKKAYRFNKDKAEAAPMPEQVAARVDEAHEGLKEVIAGSDEALMDKFFSEEPFTDDETLSGIRKALLDGSLVPVYCGCGAANLSVRELMDAVVDYMPSPDGMGDVKAEKVGSGEAVALKADPDAPLSALVFKTVADQFVGKITIFRVFSGTMKADTLVYNPTTEKAEKLAQLFVMRGKKQINVDKLIAGDIGGVAKLQNTTTNDTLCSQATQVTLAKIEFPEANLTMAVEPRTKEDEDKINASLQRVAEEDPTFRTTINPETKQTLIHGIGEQHLDVAINKIKSKFGVSVNLIDAKVPYRETIKKKVKVEGKHKKQSGGRGQYGHVWIEFERGEAEELTFQETVFGGSVPRQYFPAVEKGLNECINKGVLAGYPVVNLKATLVDGSYHDVDSSEMAFKIAASLAYKKGLAMAGPVLLEPIAHIEVVIPDDNMGEIIGDLNKRRGRILGMNPQDGGLQQVVAELPLAETFKYATDLRSMTQGRGSFISYFERYEEAPPMVAQKIIDDARKTMSDDEDED
ncbi:MAG: elongation factor G [Oscillospiraceae bacterium]|nr:elongation factor G [Oscillospiraceae bacterium]